MNYERWLHISLMGLASLALGFALLVYFVYAANLIQFPFDYDQGEGFELVDTILFSHFDTPYRDTEIWPYYASNYPPLFHVVLAPLVWLFGEAYWYGRLAGFLGTLVTASAIGYAVWQAGQRRWIAVLAGLAFLSSNTVYHIGPLLRQHMTMVMLETLAVVLLANSFPARRRSHTALGFGLLIAAGYTKQLAAITAIAALVWALLRNPRRALLWGLGFALAGILIFLMIDWSTGGQWWRQAILANVNQIDPIQIFGLAVLHFQLHGFLLVPALLLTISQLYGGRLSLYAVWFIVALGLGGIGAGTWGGGDSYYATSIAAMCILSGIFFAKLVNGEWRGTGRYADWLRTIIAPQQLAQFALVFVPILYLGYARATFKMPTQEPGFAEIAQVLSIQPNVLGRHYDSASYEVRGYANIGHLTTAEDLEAGWQIVEEIRRSSDPVLSEEAGFNLVARREVITNPTQLLNLDLKGLFDGADLIQRIEAQKFGLVILRAQFYPQTVLQAIMQAYELSTTIRMNGFDYMLLRPRTAD